MTHAPTNKILHSPHHCLSDIGFILFGWWLATSNNLILQGVSALRLFRTLSTAFLAGENRVADDVDGTWVRRPASQWLKRRSRHSA